MLASERVASLMVASGDMIKNKRLEIAAQMSINDPYAIQIRGQLKHGGIGL